MIIEDTEALLTEIATLRSALATARKSSAYWHGRFASLRWWFVVVWLTAIAEGAFIWWKVIQ